MGTYFRVNFNLNLAFLQVYFCLFCVILEPTYLQSQLDSKTQLIGHTCGISSTRPYAK